MAQEKGIKIERKLKLAQGISLAFHPFLVAPLTVALVLYLSSDDLLGAIWWASLCLLLFTMPLVLFLVYKLARKQLTDADVSVREQRYSVYVFGTGCMAVCFAVLLWLRAPSVILDMFVGGLLIVLVFALVTRFLTKVSVHTGAITAATVAAAFYSWPWAIALGGATLLVAWARLTLKRHSLVEVLSGFSIAGGILFLTLLTQQ